MTQSTTGLVEAHGEALFVLSDKLRDRGFFDSTKNSEIYERVVSTFQALSTQETTIAELVAALEDARDVIATMADCLSPLVTEALVGDPLANIDHTLTKSRSAL